MSDWFSGPRPRVIAHRGLALGAPENTLLAFVQAMAIGVTHLETDVHATSDGVAVISHDPDLGRLTGDSTPLASRTRDELRRVRLGADQTVSTLADLLDALPDAFFNIDLKVDAVVEPAVAAIDAARACDRVLITSFDDRRRQRALDALPGVATSPGSRGVVAAALAGRLRAPMIARRVFDSVDALQIPEHHRGVRILTPELVRLAHNRGVEVHVWTVNDPADMRRLLDLGVDGLITDRADLALDVVAARA
ncbi:glycerophosphodiester phosphodiesterase family protein [Frondihabitans australicus]|uniref:Glycerophosphoryl diester phosphodiesterase n=1 Tax=Frondihabitans australicus TaxID=386892 RepID=A0A495IGN3_9MICO|nr:glycerophosphodiester phosphodiesterase family protein [Frondihabitans australicus]RKR74246.1 glycerophosphoryl diester phosphodiesterase [Frondihabitans australicus]